MAPRLSGQTSIFAVVFFVFESLLGIERQKKLKKFTILIVMLVVPVAVAVNVFHQFFTISVLVTVP